MNINIQKYKRLYVLLVSLLLLVGVGVMPTLAVEYERGTAYEFDSSPDVQMFLGVAETFDVNVSFTVIGNGVQYTSISVQLSQSTNSYEMWFGGRRVFVWYENSTTTGYWTDVVYREIRFLEQVNDASLLRFLDANGVIVTTPIIDGPAIDPDDLVPGQIAGAYYQKLVDFVNIAWTSPVILTYLGVLASFIILSFIIFGSK